MWIYGLSYFYKMRVFLHVLDLSCRCVRVSGFLHVRRCSQTFVDFRNVFYGLSQMFVDFRKYVFLHFCISALRHFCISALLFSEFL